MQDLELFDPSEAARHLGGTIPISIRTLANWRVQGTGPTYVRVGGAVRYCESRVAAGTIEQRYANLAFQATDQLADN